MIRKRTFTSGTNYMWLIPMLVAIVAMGWLIGVQINQNTNVVRLNDNTIKLTGVMDNNMVHDSQIENLSNEIDQVNGTLSNVNNEVQNEIAVLRTQILELQICKNNSAENAGAIIFGQVVGLSIPPGTPEPFTYGLFSPIWDDGGYYNMSEPDRFTVPVSGRYAIGLNVNRINYQFNPSVPMSDFQLRVFIGISATGYTGLQCQIDLFYRNTDVISGLANAIFATSNLYCEVQLSALDVVRATYFSMFSGDLEGNTLNIIQTIATLSIRRIGDISV